MITEGAFGRRKSRFRVLHKKCESDKGIVKAIALVCVVLHNIYIDRGDLISRVLNLSYYCTATKCRDKEAI